MNDSRDEDNGEDEEGFMTSKEVLSLLETVECLNHPFYLCATI